MATKSSCRHSRLSKFCFANCKAPCVHAVPPSSADPDEARYHDFQRMGSGLEQFANVGRRRPYSEPRGRRWRRAFANCSEGNQILFELDVLQEGLAQGCCGLGGRVRQSRVRASEMSRLHDMIGCFSLVSGKGFRCLDRWFSLGLVRCRDCCCRVFCESDCTCSVFCDSFEIAVVECSARE